METIAIKFERTGNGLKERLHVKAFKSPNDLGAFLCKQTDNKWKGVEVGALSYLKVPYPVKSGVYASAGGAWHNVKSLDASVLAHI